jgi:hypothetical protein
VDESRPPAWKHERDFISRIAADAENLGLELRQEASVRSPKEAIAGMPERSRFIFDLAFRDRRGREVLVDAASFGRFGARPHLRYLMTKARFTAYEPLAYDPNEPFRLVPRLEPIRRVLLVDGNLAGPKHDPYRYVRALVSVGWEIERGQTDFLLRIADANIQEGN